MTAPKPERTGAVQADVDEFIDYVTKLAQVAGVLAARAEVAAPALTFEEAVNLFDRCSGSISKVQAAQGSLGARIGGLWDAGETAVIEIKDEGVEIVATHHAKDPREWDHKALAHAVVRARLAKLVEQGAPAPDPFTVADWLLDAELPSYWRLQELDRLGIDSTEFFTRRHERNVTTRRREKAA